MSSYLPDWEQALTRAIGKRLRRVRKTRGWSLAQAGKHSGLTYRLIQKYETGHQRISIPKLIRLATAYGVPCSYFLENHDPALTKPCKPETMEL